ncbi:MAG: Cys-tRNA(Pro) deacylase [Tyzzerella sp.]|nr:Cys-tRNA(Pro) deacylase [Tyzzerella sp.]
MAKKENKTNAMRILEKMKIPFEMRTYECDEFIDGMQTADLLGMPHEIMYKTLVTVGKSKANYVFVIPIAEEIDFKKAAKAVNEKSLEMLPLKDLTAVTGYIRGGCTAIGMKKKFKTVIQEDATKLEKMVVSGGRIGLQLILLPEDLRKASDAEFADVIRR